MPIRLLALALALAVPGLAQEGPTVQSRWRIAVATAGWDKTYPARDLAVDGAAFVARELPGLTWHVAERTLEVDLDVPYGDPGFSAALGRAIRPGDLPEDLDVLLVYTPFTAESRYFGYALQRFRPGGDPAARPLWYAAINLRPDRVAIDRAANLASGADLVDGEDARRAAGRLAALSNRLLGSSRLLRHALVLTTVHEFGHFLCPGDRDVKDGIADGWLKNGQPDHNPDDHGADCIMYNAPTPESIVAKALRSFPDGVSFCDRCRRRLGVSR